MGEKTIRVFDPVENAKDVEYVRKNLFNAIKTSSSKEIFWKEKCTHCSGEGWSDGWPCRKQCHWCNGTGTIEMSKTIHYIDVENISSEDVPTFIAGVTAALEKVEKK
jgi:DnaJ-class molecular chaperone